MRTMWLRELKRRPVIMVAAAVAGLLFAGAILVPLLSDTDPNRSNLALRLQAPSWAGGEGGLLGTDEVGRDLFLRIMYGIRTSFFVGAGAALTACVIGVTIGMLAGYFGGIIDAVLMRITDIQLAFPGLLIVMVIIRMIGQGTLTLILVLGLIAWMLYARVVRGAVLTIRSSELVTSSAGIGASTPRILLTHILPNVAAATLAVFGVNFAQLLLAEASLSFLGFGVQTPTISTGAILASGRDHLTTSWWISTFAGLFLMLCVLSTNLVANWIQRLSDPLNVRSRA